MSMFISRRHAENTAASLRETAQQERQAAAENARNRDRFGASISAGNVLVLEARARLADEAAGLLGDPGER